jgi:eukaryotic-like serine/threonine-protein kinase
MKKTTYGHKWTKGERLGKGGQGLTYFSEPIPKDGNVYALKLLKEQRNQERRDRMFIEVTATQILEHPNIPQFIDSNAHEYKNNEVDLYLVSEYINGPTLQEFITQNGGLSLADSITLNLRLIEIITYCHLKGFFHRDIKPDNIIISGNNIENPFLIDFGLSFNEEISKNETPSWQHIGNRFLSLPELRVSEGNKKDRRSDVTMFCGVFLFCLTGVHPTDLLDETQTKPHRRSKSKAILQKIDKVKLEALNRFFDIAFNVGINDRWQSAEAVRKALLDLQKIKSSDEMEESDTSNKLEAFKKSISDRQDYRHLENLKSIFEKCNKTISQACQSVIAELKSENFGSIQGGFNINMSKQVFTNGIGITHPYHGHLNFYPRFTCYTNGSELVLEASENGNKNEFLRHPLNEEIDWSSLEESLRTFYINGITSKQE